VSNTAIEAVRDAVAKQGLSAVARALDLPRTTISSVLSGAAREVSVLAVEARAERLQAGGLSPRDRAALVVGAVTTDPAALLAAEDAIRAIDPTFGRPVKIVDSVAAGVARHGLPAAAAALGCLPENVGKILDGSAPIYVVQVAVAHLPALRALDREADAAAAEDATTETEAP
jgi:hypothetical protein